MADEVVTEPVAAPAEVAPEATPEATPEPDLFENPTLEQFPRSYVEQLRREAADHRTKYTPYKEVFGDADDEVREYLLELNRALINDPVGAIEEIEQLAQQLKDAKAAREKVNPTPATPAVSDDDKPMTKADWKRLQDEEREVERRTSELSKLHQEVADLGYDRDQDEYGDLASLLAIATKYTDGDLSKAHAKRVARFEEAVKVEVQAEMARIKEGKTKWPAVAVSGTSPAEEKDEPKTIAEAGRRARAYIERMA